MLEEGRVTHKSNIVYLQFKLLSTHVRFGGQDGGQDDVREPLRGKNRLNKNCVQGRMRETSGDKLRVFKLVLFTFFTFLSLWGVALIRCICLECNSTMRVYMKSSCGYWRGEKRKRPPCRNSEVAAWMKIVKDSCWFSLCNSCCNQRNKNQDVKFQRKIKHTTHLPTNTIWKECVVVALL